MKTKKPTIALAFILKGTEEPSQIVRLLSSVAPYVDAIYATVTWDLNGKAVPILRSFNANVSFFGWIKDFASARNYNFSQVPERYDYIIWLDSDDEVVGGEYIKKYLLEKKDRYFAIYNYEIDKDTGAVLTAHPRERIFKNGLVNWVGRLHETPVLSKTHIDQLFMEEVVVNHRPTKENVTEGAKRNLEILLLQLHDEGGNPDPRTLYYLGRQYFDLDVFDKAESFFWQYLGGKNPSGWDEERAQAYNYLGIIYLIAKRYDDAKPCFHMAMDERPEFPTWYINLAHVYADQKDWDKALFWVTKGLSMKQPKTAMVLNPRDDQVRALNIVYEACMAQRKLKEAFAASEKLCQLFPNDDFYKGRLKSVYNILRWTDMGKSVKDLLDELELLDEKHKARAILDNLPSTLDNAYTQKLRQEYVQSSKWPEKSIVYYCGKSLEEWDETSPKKGIGGSETAVAQLTKYWAQNGYKVTVFGLPFEEHVDQYGVTWKMYWRFNPDDEFDIFISWRNETLFNRDIKARLKLIDLHDTPEAGEYYSERTDRIDKIMVKSKYQRDYLPHLKDDKFAIIPNGVDLDVLPDQKITRDNKRLIYAHSYDRGLESMLLYGWPLIKKEVPDAKLDIYYGWNIFDRFFSNHKERQAWKAKMVKLIEDSGAVEHGRIGQKELLLEKSKSAINYYGSTFTEIDCISVRESASVGCVPFTTDFAVLGEKPYCEMVTGDPEMKETQEALARRIIVALKNPKLLEEKRSKYAELAKKESWKNIANNWMEVFES